MWQLAASLWHQLSAAEQAVWETQGTARHMTGFAWYMSQALRPNPGIYLPLAGGTMSGNIDMDGNQVTDLIDPTDPGHAARKSYVDAAIANVTMQAARCRRTSTQAIPHDTPTLVVFDTEDYDNADMWEGVTNPTRITITKDGIYLAIAQIHWQGPSVPGYRITYISHSVAGYIAQSLTYHSADTMRPYGQSVSTWECVAGQYFQVYVYQNTTNPLNLLADGNQASSLQVIRIA